MKKNLYNHTLRAIATTIVICCFALSSGAADGFRSVLLSDMAVAMKMRPRMLAMKNGTHVGELTYAGLPITVVVKDGTITHIGFSIFTSDHRQYAYSPFFDAIERFCLIPKLPMKRDKNMDRELFEEGIHIDAGSLSMLPELYNKPDVEFSLYNEDGKKYHAVWSRDNNTLADITMPFTYGLLHGTSMEENENILISDLMNAATKEPDNSIFAPVKVNRDELITYFPYSYYILPGEAYYFDNLNSNMYYTIADSTDFAPIFDVNYPLESLANVTTSLEVPNDIMLKIKVIQYNYRNTTVDLPLAHFVKYCLDNGCTPFFGVLSNTTDKTVCQIIMRNIDEGYCHLLKIESGNIADESIRTTISARMNPYIPISKISALFADPTESEQVKDRPTRTIKFKKK